MSDADQSPRLIFLSYISRSGSTLLARLLSELPGVEATLEANFPDGVFRPELIINEPDDIPSALDRLYADPKFQGWQVSREALAQWLKSQNTPLRFAQILDGILKLTFPNRPHTILIKQDNAIWRTGALRQRYPDAHVLFVERDPRAVFNSQLKSMRSDNGKPMATNPILNAIMFERARKIIHQHAQMPWFYHLQFEALVSQPQQTLQNLCQHFDINMDDTTQDADSQTSYQQRIPEQQRHLHTIVDQAPKQQRAEAWQTELSPIHIDAIQFKSARTMKQAGYECIALSISCVKKYGYRTWYAMCTIYPLARAALRLARLKSLERLPGSKSST
ncbi:MAG: sulfotransferase family protein [Phycisphaeraceae bacterium JB051]